MPSPAPDASSDKSNALANSALPSDKNSILEPAPVDFFQASNTHKSLTPVTGIVSTPLPLKASAFFKKPGRWLLLHVGVNAPGTAKSTTFLPLNISAVVFTAGPSGPITRNFASGRRSPTFTGMFLSSRYADRFVSGALN